MSTEVKTVEEGNRLIAEFMGYKFSGDGIKMHFNVIKPNESDWYFGSWELEGYQEFLKNDLQYHSSWDWLMPVIIKTNEIYESGIGEQMGRELWNEIYHMLNKINIERTHHAVIEFILWYNNQSNT